MSQAPSWRLYFSAEGFVLCVAGRVVEEEGELEEGGEEAEAVGHPHEAVPDYMAWGGGGGDGGGSDGGDGDGGDGGDGGGGDGGDGGDVGNGAIIW